MRPIVPTFDNAVVFNPRNPTHSSPIPQNNQPITDHPAVFAQIPEIGLIATVNLWCPTTPIAPFMNPRNPKDGQKAQGAWELDSEHHVEQMQKMATYLFDILKSGVAIIAMQEVPHNPAMQALLLSSLDKLAFAHTKNQDDPKINIDINEIKRTWQAIGAPMPTGENKFGNAVILNHAIMDSISAPIDDPKNPGLKTNQYPRCGVHIVTTKNQKIFTLHNIHGDGDPNQEQNTIDYCNEKMAKGDVALGDLNIRSLPNTSISFEKIGNTYDAVFVDKLNLQPKTGAPAQPKPTAIIQQNTSPTLTSIKPYIIVTENQNRKNYKINAFSFIKNESDILIYRLNVETKHGNSEVILKYDSINGKHAFFDTTGRTALEDTSLLVQHARDINNLEKIFMHFNISFPSLILTQTSQNFFQSAKTQSDNPADFISKVKTGLENYNKKIKFSQSSGSKEAYIQIKAALEKNPQENNYIKNLCDAIERNKNNIGKSLLSDLNDAINSETFIHYKNSAQQKKF